MQKNKKYLIASICLILFLLPFVFSKMAAAYESESTTRFNFELQSNNYEMLGQMATLNTYAFYQFPTLNSIPVDHDVSRVSISQLQRFANFNSTNNQNLSQSIQTQLASNITNYTCSAPFDTLFQLNLNCTTNSYNNYSSGYSINNGSLISGTIDSTKIHDGTCLEINGTTEGKHYATSYSGCPSSGSLSDTYSINSVYHSINPDPTPWGKYYFSLTESATYKFYFQGSNTAACDILGYDKTDNIFGFSMGVSVADFAAGITWIVAANGVSYIQFQSDSVQTLRIDYIMIEKTAISTVNVSIAGPQIASVLNNSVNVQTRVSVYAPDADISTLNINGLNVSVPENTLTNYSFVMTYPTLNFNITATSTAGYNPLTLKIDFIFYQLALNPVINITALNTTYVINSITYSQNVSLSYYSGTGSQTGILLQYRWDSTQLTHYDHISDLQFVNFTQFFLVNLNFSALSFNFYYNVSYSTNEWVVPSEVALTCNLIDITDETFNSGFVAFADFQNSFSFSGNTPNLIFNYSIDCYFSNSIDLDVISSSYYRKTLLLNTNHDLNLTQIDFQFNATIKHSYVNNIDFGSDKMIFPFTCMVKYSSITVEVILDDNAYIPLTPTKILGNNTVSLNIFANSQTFLYTNIGTRTLSYNMPSRIQASTATVNVSNFRYSQPYSHTENSTNIDSVETQNPSDSICTITNSSEYMDYSSILSTNSTGSYNTSSRFDGFYNATAIGSSFKSTSTGSLPSNWASSGTYDAAPVIVGSVLNHSKVLYVNGKSTGSWAHLKCAIPVSTEINFSFWFYPINVQSWNHVLFADSDSSDMGAAIRFDANHAGYSTSTTWGAGWAEISPTCYITPNAWTEFKLYWKKNTNCQIWLNNTKYYDGAGLNPAVDIVNIDFITWSSDYYIDAPSISTDTGYYDNIAWSTINTLNTTYTFNLTSLTLKNIKSINANLTLTSNLTGLVSNVSLYNYISNQTEYKGTLNCSSALNLNISDYVQCYFNSTCSIQFNLSAFNSSSGYSLNFSISLRVFYYNESNMQFSPNVIISYESKVFVGETNNISIQIQKTVKDISAIYFWTNLTGSNLTLGITEGIYSVLLSNLTSQSYSIEIYCNDTNQNWKRVRIDNLFIAKNETIYNLFLYSRYYQNSTTNITTNSNQNITLKIYYPNSTLFRIDTNTSYFNFYYNTTGWYLLNAIFPGNQSFLSHNISMAFELYPIEHSESLAFCEIALNSTTLTSDSTTLSHLGNSPTFIFSSKTGTLFDMNLSFTLNYTANFSQTALITYTFTASSDITQIHTTNVSISNYSNFEMLYYNSIATTNYTINNSVLYLTAVNDTDYFNADSFSVQFGFSNDLYLEQMDSAIDTDDTSISFREYAYSTRAFRNWYIESNYTINSATATHLSSGTIHSTVKYGTQFYFSQNATANDLFEIDWEINPEFDVDYTILTNNGTYMKLRVDVFSNITVANLTIFINPGIYFSTWTNATQDIYSNRISFFVNQTSRGTTIYYLEGLRDVPECSVYAAVNGQAVELYPGFNSTVVYMGFLNYNEYSEVWKVPLESDWELDGIHYDSHAYTISDSGVFFCPGWNENILSSYLQFQTNPLKSYTIDLTNTTISLLIDLELPIANSIIKFPIQIAGNYKIKNDDDLLRLYELDGWEWYQITNYTDLHTGLNIFQFQYEIYTISKIWYYLLPCFIIGLVAAVWYIRKNQKPGQKNKAKFDLKAWLKSKFAKKSKHTTKSDVKKHG